MFNSAPWLPACAHRQAPVHRRQMMMLIVMAALGAVPAAAQEKPAAPPTAEAYRQVTRACRAEYASFCQSQSAVPVPAPVSGRDQAICLKYHRQDLSLSCRNAVNAVSR